MIKSFFLLFLFLCVHFGKTTAQESKPTEYLNSPYSTMKTFLQSMKKVKKGDKDEMTRVLETLDLSHFSGPSRVESGILAAQRLINTIDRLEYVNLEDIPKKNDGPDWIFRKQTVFLADGAHQVEITISKSTDGNWRFSPETVDSIKYFYLAFKDRPIVKGAYEYITWKTRFKNLMPQWMGSRIFIFQNGQWIALFLLIFLGLLFERVMRFVLNRYVLSLFKKKGLSIDQNFSQKFILPFGVITVSGVWILGLPLLELDDRVLSLFLRIGQVFFAIGSVWFAYLLVDLIASYFEKLATKSENKFDDILVPLLRKSAKIFVVCVGMVFIGHSLTLNVTNILAGLGIGGLAFALAAKDMLSNLFGSLSVILDRPFHIGDWVLINDNIEGTVTEVGFRSTRLRTFYDSFGLDPFRMVVPLPDF